MEKIKFTVLMCTYIKDDPILLQKAIDSIFKNSIKPDYFILTIDGPIHIINQRVIEKLCLKYPIKLNILKKNIGLALALNNALSLVNTEWVARADSDDINLKNRFENQVKYAKQNFDVIGSNILEIGEKMKIRKLKKIMPVNNNDIRNYIRTRNPMNHMTVFFKTDLVRSVGGYPNIYLREDYALWAKLYSKGASFYNLDKILVHVKGGRELYKRRGGFKNAIGEIKLQIYFLKYKIKPFYLSIFHLFFRPLILLLPRNILEIIYTEFLRTR